MAELVVGFVPGVTPRKWFTAWRDRMREVPLTGVPVAEHEQLDALVEGRVRMCLVRLPFDSPEHHLIPLYEEQPVVVVPADHFVTAAEEVALGDVADELLDPPAGMGWSDRIALVAGGAGLLVAPVSVAREFHRKDLAWRAVVDLPTTRVGLAWARDDPDPLLETFVGIVRGRTSRSSRGPGGARATTTPKPAEKPRRASPRRRTGPGRRKRR